MKNHYALLTLLFTTIGFAQCPPGNVILSTQADVNAFAVNYPSCTSITGNLYISGSNITDLTPLSNLTSVSQELAVYFSPSIVSLNGLNGINSVGTITVSGNQMITDLSALSNLTTVTNTISIANCPQLTSLNGLQGITSAGGLCSIKGLPIANLDGLNNLSSIGFFLEISNHPQLTSLNGFENLTAIGGYIEMKNNPMLSDITGIENISPGSITSIWIDNCGSLSFCSIDNFCTYLQSVGSGTFTNNLTGCNSPSQITDACLLSTDEITMTKFDIAPNPVDDYIYISETNSLIKSYEVSDAVGKIIIRGTGDTKSINVSNLSKGHYILSVEVDQSFYKTRFIKQ